MILFNDSDLDLVCTCSTTTVLFNAEFAVLCVLFCNDWALIATCGKALIHTIQFLVSEGRFVGFASVDLSA